MIPSEPFPNHSVWILIVEDSPTQAQRLEHILSGQGYEVRHAPNGRIALEMLTSGRPHLIVSDVIMPEMDGYELCRRIKDDPKWTDIPVILVTTLSDPGDVIRGLECRADNFILKPYDERYLLSRVQYVLLNRQMRQTEQHGGLAVEIFFNGQKHVITADRLQILNLLLSTYDAAIQRNKELTRAKDALTESEERVRLVINTAQDAFIGIDEEGVIVEWNIAAEQTFGWSRAEVIGRSLATLVIPPQYRDQHQAGMRRLLATGEGPILHRRVQLSALRRNGEEFPVDLTIWPIQIGRERVFNAFIRDITDQKRSEEAVQRAVAEAERANRAKSEFLSRMSHDLRTPLNAILGFAQLLAMDVSDPEQRENADHIAKAGEHLLDMINEVLDIARIEAGHLSLSLEAVPVADVVQHAVDLVRPLALQRLIGFEIDGRSIRDLHVLADRQRLSQVLLNLLSNAVKYNRQQGRIVVGCEEAPGRRLQIRVTDTGPGLSPEKLACIFQPFERLGAEQTGIEGTGLGLALAKALTEAMGGTLTVTSELDRGSTFSVELALAERSALAVEESSVASEQSAIQDSGAIGTVLYIEDNISNRQLMERVFARRAGVRLIGVSQGQTGVDLARADPPDLILLDLHLPDMHGEEVLRRLAQDARTRGIPVAVLSADAMPAQSKRLLAAGATAYLTKPLNISEVLQLVDATLRGGSTNSKAVPGG